MKAVFTKRLTTFLLFVLLETRQCTMAYNYNVLHIANIRMDDMGYADMIRNDANSTDIREYLVSGDQTAITIRIPDTLRDAAKEAAALKGTSLSAYVRESLIKELTNGR